MYIQQLSKWQLMYSYSTHVNFPHWQTSPALYAVVHELQYSVAQSLSTSGKKKLTRNVDSVSANIKQPIIIL